MRQGIARSLLLPELASAAPDCIGFPELKGNKVRIDRKYSAAIVALHELDKGIEMPLFQAIRARLRSAARPAGKQIAFGVIIGFVTLLPHQLHAQEQGDWILRMGAMGFNPSVNSSLLQSTSESFSAPVSGSVIGVDSNAQFGLSLGYMFSDSWAIEAMTTAPFEHNLTVSGLEQFGLTTYNLGETKQLPPTISVLHYFNLPSSKLRPYLGLGLNYTHFFDDSLSNQARTELGAQGLELDESFGVALRAGVDWKLNAGWFLNASIWRYSLETNASFMTNTGRFSTDLSLDPWVYSITLGHDF